MGKTFFTEKYVYSLSPCPTNPTNRFIFKWHLQWKLDKRRQMKRGNCSKISHNCSNMFSTGCWMIFVPYQLVYGLRRAILQQNNCSIDATGPGIRLPMMQHVTWRKASRDWVEGGANLAGRSFSTIIHKTIIHVSIIIWYILWLSEDLMISAGSAQILWLPDLMIVPHLMIV